MRHMAFILGLLLSSLLCLPSCLQADTVRGKRRTPADSAPRTAVKLNAALLAGIINPAVEFRVSEHYTVQFEAMACFQQDGFLWTDKPVTLAETFLELRYYPRQTFTGFYIGPHAGYAVYRMTKGITPGYWDSYPDRYQVGNNMMFGITAGWHFRLTGHWGLELSYGLGWQHSWYERYMISENAFLDGHRDADWNKSAEWLPLTKAALNVVFRW